MVETPNFYLRFSGVRPFAISEQESELIGWPISGPLSTCCVGLELRPLHRRASVTVLVEGCSDRFRLERCRAGYTYTGKSATFFTEHI